MKNANSFPSSPSFTASTTSIHSISGAASERTADSSFEELVSKLFSCNIVLVHTDQARQCIKSCFGNVTSFASVLNQFASISDLRLTIRDLNGHNAYGLNKLRFRFFDVEQFKTRPSGTQLKKLHFDVISSMSNSYLNNPSAALESDEDDVETPWYDLWRNIFIDTFEPSDHDFIGSNCGCFFVITKHELPHYKVIFERLCSSVKQNSTLRFIQSDFVRYFIVLSDQVLEPSAGASADDGYTRTCHQLKVEFPNSFIFFIEQQQLQEQSQHANSMFSVGDGDTAEHQRSLNSEMSSLSIGDDQATDPLNAATLEFQQSASGTNSRFYNQLVNQRTEMQKQQQQQQQQNSTTSNAGGASSTTASVTAVNTREMFNDWIGSAHHAEQLKLLSEAISGTIDLMLREFITKSLVPWAERQIKILGELIAQRKGFRKSIFSATKSLISNMSSSTASLTKTITGSTTSLGGMPSGVIYIPDAQEMQQRKLADICMIFGVYEMAYSLYYAARKDFQTEGAWLYYAGASEMSAIASYFIQKFHPNYFDQAITTYLDPCRSVSLATRSTILATELFCQMNRHIDSANLFIRLTGDDSDLRSALFLEQASKCFFAVSASSARNAQLNSQLARSASTQSLLSVMSRSTNIETVGPFGVRYRKAAFHYILAGHRYNRCGLKHFSLKCYRRFNYPFWEAASDHVNLTVAKLYSNIAAANAKKFADYYLKGLDIYRSCSHKQIFFVELFRELKKHHTSSCDPNANPDVSPTLYPELYRLDIPFIQQYLFISLDSLQPQEYSFKSKNQRHICFLGEQIEICFTFSAPFPMSLANLKLICNAPDGIVQLGTVAVQSPLTFESAEQQLEMTLQLTPLAEAEFSLQGIEFTMEGVPFYKYFSERMQQSLNFKAVRTLPLIPIDIAIPQLGLDIVAVNQSKHAQNSVLMIPEKVFASEKITLQISTPATAANWAPASFQLFTSARQYYPWPSSTSSTPTMSNSSLMFLPFEEETVEEFPVPIQYGLGALDLQIHVPPKVDRHLVSFRLVYLDGETKQTRTVLRKLCFEVAPCLDIEARFGSVITLRSLLPTEPVAIFDVTIGDDQTVPGATDPADASFVTIPVGHAAHLLVLKNFIRWTLPTTLIQSNNAVPGLVRNGMILFS